MLCCGMGVRSSVHYTKRERIFGPGEPYYSGKQLKSLIKYTGWVLDSDRCDEPFQY